MTYRPPEPKPGPQEDLPEAATPAPGWDEGVAPAVPAQYDYESLVRYDVQIRWTLYAAALPFLLVLVELVFCNSRFTPGLPGFSGIVLCGLLALGARRMTIRLGVNFLYLGFFFIQYKLFGTAGTYEAEPAVFTLLAGVGGLCVLCNLVATMLLVAQKQVRMPPELAGQVGHIFGSEKELRRVLEVYRAADEARANQAWAKQAGRQE